MHAWVHDTAACTSTDGARRAAKIQFPSTVGRCIDLVSSVDSLGAAAGVVAEVTMELAADAALEPQEARLLGDGEGPPRPARTSTSQFHSLTMSVCPSLFLEYSSTELINHIANCLLISPHFVY
jgi:hypothetical protein